MCHSLHTPVSSFIETVTNWYIAYRDAIQINAPTWQAKHTASVSMNLVAVVLHVQKLTNL
jgi:hypothetical protein